MNSLNESTNMIMVSSPSHETPPSPTEVRHKESVGSMAQGYKEMFPNPPDHLNKRAPCIKSDQQQSSHCSASQTSSFPDANPSVQYHSNTPVGYVLPSACPRQQMTHDKKCQVSSLDNGHYTNPAASNEKTCQSSQNISYGSFYAAGETACPWKLAAGSKVLVREESNLNKAGLNVFIIINV